MCTDEQWTPRGPTGVMMISKFWIPSSDSSRAYNRHTENSFWLTPLDVPRHIRDYKLRFPSSSPACSNHMPAKLK